MSRRKLKAVEYDRDYVNFDGKNFIIKFDNSSLLIKVIKITIKNFIMKIFFELSIFFQFFPFADDEEIRRFIATIEEVYLKKRPDNWAAQLLDEQDSAKWTLEMENVRGIFLKIIDDFEKFSETKK